MSKKNKVPESHNTKVWSMAQFIMISKEGKSFDGYVRDERGNYMLVISKPRYLMNTNSNGTLYQSKLTYTYMFFPLAPEGVGCWVWRQRQQHLFFDRKVESSQVAVTQKYGVGVDYMREGSGVEIRDSVTKEITESFRVFIGEDRKGYVVDKNGTKLPNDRTIKTEGGTTIFATSDNSLDPSTLYRNYLGTSYVGDRNPKNYDGQTDNYDFLPESPIEWAAYFHDRRYDMHRAVGKNDAYFNTDVLSADAALTRESFLAIPLGIMYPSKTADNSQIARETLMGIGVVLGFGAITIFKTVKRPVDLSDRKINNVIYNGYYKDKPHNIPASISWSQIQY